MAAMSVIMKVISLHNILLMKKGLQLAQLRFRNVSLHRHQMLYFSLFMLLAGVVEHHPVLAAVEQQLVSQKQLQLNIAETRQMIFRNG